MLNQITDTQGRVLPVTMNTNGQITKIADPSGRSWNYTYAGTAGNRLATFTDPNGGVTKYVYDTSNRLKKLTTPGGRITEITYDADNRVSEYVRVTDTDEESGPTTRVRYDQDDPRCDDTENGETRRTTVVTDPRGNETTYCINPQLQVVTTIDAKGHQQQISYTNQGQVQKFTDGTGSGAAVNTAGYDGLSNLSSLKGAEGETSELQYKPEAQATTLTEKYQPTSQASPDGQQQFFGYNAQGDVTSVKDDQNNPQQQATLDYNTDGTIKTAKDGENRQTSYGYYTQADGGNRKGLLKTYGPPAPRVATTINYDALGRVISAKDGNNKTTSYTYDKLDRVKTTTFDDGSTLTYTYDADGNRTEAADTVWGTEPYTYDELNRRSSETLTGGRTTSYGYDASGNLTQVADAQGITGYGYDELNRTCYVAPTDGGGGSCASAPSGATTFQYDAAGHRTKTSYPNGIKIDEAPDMSGKPKTITAGTGANQISRNYSYAAFAGGKSGTLVQSMQVNGGDTETYTYDGSARLATLKIGGAAGVDQVTYTYDKAGNRTGFGVAANPANTIAPYAATSTYNGANQLTAQNRNTKTDGASNRTFTYDGQGNDFDYDWSARNQMRWDTVRTFNYQGANMADLRDDGTTSVDSNLLGMGRRYDGPDDDHPTTFLRAPDGDLLARKSPSGAWSYYVKDALGSVIGVYNASGTLTKKYDYDPDGNTWRDSSGKPEDFGYTGAYTKTGTQTLYHMGLRWYDPKTTRWISADSLDQPGDLQNANPYIYGASNPLNNTDPTGTCIVVSCDTYHKVGSVAKSANRVVGAGMKGAVSGGIEGGIVGGLAGGNVLEGAAVGAAAGAADGVIGQTDKEIHPDSRVSEGLGISGHLKSAYDIGRHLVR